MIIKIVVVWNVEPLCRDGKVTLHTQALHDVTPHLLLGSYYYTCLFHCWMVVFKITVVWNLTPFSVVALYQCSGDPCCLHRKGNLSSLKMEATDSSPLVTLPIYMGVTFERTVIFINDVVCHITFSFLIFFVILNSLVHCHLLSSFIMSSFFPSFSAIFFIFTFILYLSLPV